MPYSHERQIFYLPLSTNRACSKFSCEFLLKNAIIFPTSKQTRSFHYLLRRDLSMSSQKVWFVTGVSMGFGRCLVDAILDAGDCVYGTLRQSAQIDEFNAHYAGKPAYPLLMDVNNPEQRRAAIERILEVHGRIDVLVNNAGYGFFGAIEEATLQDARDQMETNFFSVLALTQEVLPLMRQQCSGHIVQISSVAGIAALPGLGIYNASKFALEGFSEALAQEVAPLSIGVTLVEPGPFRTAWAGASSTTATKRIKDYATTAHLTMDTIHGYSGKQAGDPVKAAALIVRAIRSGNAPLRLPLGHIAIDRIRKKWQSFEQEIATWEQESIATSYDA
jgi:NAD(P)-dependent dehydrogenase (short-subunit alcohol dehydrogenase family)